MPNAKEDEDQNEHESAHKAREVARLGWSVYQQVASPFSAIGLIALIAGLWHLGLHGFIAWLVGIWDATVRPTVDLALHDLVTVPMGWLHVHFEVPPAARDYLSVGLVLALSTYRALRQPWRRHPTQVVRRFFAKRDYRLFASTSSFVRWLIHLPYLILLTWPLALAWDLIVNTFRALSLFRERRSTRRHPNRDLDDNYSKALHDRLTEDLRANAPLFYLVLLLAINFWLLR